MLYLIGGTPRGGKTILSRKLSKKLNIPFLSTDSMRMITMAYFKGEDIFNYFPFEKMFDHTAIDKFFTNYSGRQMLAAEQREAKSIWPGVKNLIEHFLLCRMDYIIEGVHLSPNLVKKFKDNRNVKIIYLAKMDKEKIYEGMLRNKGEKDWIMENTQDKKIIRLAAKSFSVYGDYFKKESKKYNLKLINTEDNFYVQINKAVHFLTN